ncbi:hypothetical protein ASPZODRAFT_149834 [Penicilliopsis zonata CBS 506.65]|uniref:Major facilitator superfamily (MFS) profile domain-containing protein n=1 Tax=Penicilliopsis zonata CBS 506.65 TaxID=1073090 RepID=A0A1L9SP67_9EURO|nr:hypothetical protein ASPZODRAFT_149834 [Penicilliopsis zonata CBS 506.65]OJJ48844.1 hypothetical protein ASPZODRAFT_149834 [Penicilliopsis zonata CBS 506.65]
MIGATRRWFRRNRRGLAVGAAVVGASYLAGQYLLSKISEARERMSSDRIARENLRRRFEQNQTDCTYTVLALLPTAAEDIIEALPVEELTQELQKKRAERLARLNAGEATSSDLSSVAPSIIEDDRKSMSSFQSENFVHASQLGEQPAGEGEGQPRVKRNRAQLWNEIKISSITRSFTMIYTLSLLTMFTRIQLNLLGRRNYLSSVISLATPPANASAIRLEDHDDELAQTFGNDFETNRRYLAFSWWLLHRGWRYLMTEVQAAVTEAFGALSPREDITLEKLSELTLQVRQRVEGDTEEQRRVLQESGVLGVSDPSSPQTASTLRTLLDETADLIESPSFTQVLTLLNNEGFATLVEQRVAAEAFRSTSSLRDPETVPQSFSSVATVVPPTGASGLKTKLANVLAVMTRQAHAIGNGSNPPNDYLVAMEQGVRELEAFAAVASELASDQPALGTVNERKLMAKIDWHILAPLCVLYLLAFLDRVNISNAAVFGLKTDLNITSGTKYNAALTIFFVPYIIFEIPSNLLLKKLKPHVWLPLCMFGFGLVMICQGLVSSWGGLMAARFFLGVFETGMFPGCECGFYLMGMWYKRSEAQKRFSFFFSSTTLAGAFGGLLASAIGKMSGMRGYLGWRWIFILEGTLTCIVSFIWFFVIPDFPEDVKWLTAEEREFLQAKLSKDVGKSAHDTKIGLREVLDVFKDSITTQLYSIPPWAAAFGLSLCVAFLSDKFRHRFAFVIIPICIAIAGFAILLTVHGTAHRHVEYGALFLVTSGTYSAMPVIVCWFAMNLGGHHRRSIGTAWQVGFGNIGGIIATYSFLSKDAPLYRPGYSICLSFICLSAVACTVYLVAVWHENRKRDANMITNPEALGDNTEEDVGMLGDLAPGYRYNY